MALRFTWRVHATASGKAAYTISRSQFGNGYRQDVPIGRNNKAAKWNVTVSGYRAQVMPIIAFLDAHKGATKFEWKPPLSDTWLLWTCDGYTPQDQGGGYFTLTMDFEQAFAP